MYFSCGHLPLNTVKYYFSHMDIRKIFVICVVMFVAACGIFAMSADDIVNKAIQSSVTIRTLEISNENSILAQQMDDAKKGLSITVSSGDITVQKETALNPFFQMSPYVEVVLPENDDMTLSFKLQNDTDIYKNGDSAIKLTPSASYLRNISLDSFKDTRKDITKQMSRLRQELSYKKSVLQFRNSVLQTIEGILKSQLSIETQELTYKRLVADYESDIASGNITKDGLKDLQARMKIESTRVSLENAKVKLDKTLQDFRNDYGFDFETPDSVRTADLKFEENKYGNTTVVLAELSLNIANQELEIATGTPTKLSLGANAQVPVTLDNMSDLSAAVAANVSGTVTGSNYSVGAKAGGIYNYYYYDFPYDDIGFYPYITLTGSWHNKATQTTDDLNVQTLKNKVVLAQIEYDDALSSYRDECATLRTDIENLRTEVEQFEVSADYDLRILERVNEMFSLGLVTRREVEDAQLAVDADKIQRLINAIDALVIENRIAINQL